MKILYDYQAFSIQKYGGISKYFCELHNRLNKYGNCNSIILAPFYINLYLNKMKMEHVIGRHVPDLPETFKLREYANFLGLMLLSRNLNIDIYHETYYSRWQIKRHKNVKYVTTVHDMIHEKFSAYFKDALPIRKAKLRSVQNADMIFCDSENTKKDLMDICNVNASKILVTYLGWESDLLECGSNKRIVDSEYILHVGLRTGHKNIYRLLESFASSEKIRNNFKLVFFGTQKFTKLELDKISSLHINDRVIYVGSDSRVLKTLYSGASAFVYPSLYEGFGIPPLEAMSHNCPVICSNTSSLPEVVGEAAELFDPYNIESISDAMSNVLFDNIRRKELITAGRERIKLFSWDKCAMRTFEGYRSLF